MNKNACPLAASEKRLIDCLNLFVETKTKYFDPDAFRLSLNNCIQTLRTVTFVLQKSKSISLNFDNWYEDWRTKMRGDQIIKWLLEARNTIVKEGDLITQSVARASIVESWLGAAIFEMEIPPLTKTEKLAKLLSHATPDKDKYKVGLLRVERRWVDSKLPRFEILDSLGHCFQVLSELLFDAHINLLPQETLSDCSWYTQQNDFRGRLPPCMLAQEWDRTIWVDLKTGEPLEFTSFIIKSTAETKEKARQRYFSNRDHIQKTKPETLEDEVNFVFEFAKKVLVTDGCHLPTAIIGYTNGHKEIQQLWFEDRTEKHLILRKLASYIEKTGAESIIIINEAWVADLKNFRITPYEIKSPNRREMLQVIGTNNNEETYCREIFFKKDNHEKVQLEEEGQIDTGHINFLVPIQKAWKKQNMR